MDDCHPSLASCSDTNGSFACTCNAGYDGNGTTCDDVDECAAGTNNCADNNRSSCNNTYGSFTCECSPGWLGDGVECENTNECIPTPYWYFPFPNVSSGSAMCGNMSANCTADGENCTVAEGCSCSNSTNGTNCTSGESAELVEWEIRCEWVSSNQTENQTGNTSVAAAGNLTNATYVCSNVSLWELRYWPAAHNCDELAQCSDTNGSFTCSCQAGYVDVDGGTACDDFDECAAVGYNESGTFYYFCTPESANCVNTVGSFYCECNKGYSGSNDGINCTACSPGSYKDTFGNASCVHCPVDTYSPQTASGDAANCVACPSNTVSYNGSSALLDCVCKKGWTGPDGSESCTACALGKYKEERGNGTCSSCPSNNYLNFTGSYDADDCVACDPNAASPEASGSATDCKCNMGWEGMDGEACVACAAGKYKDTVGNATCTDCDAGTYSEADRATSPTTCLACHANSYSGIGTDLKTGCTCNAGYTGHNGVVCRACPMGTYKPVQGPDACTECPINSIGPLASTTSEACDCRYILCVDCRLVRTASFAWYFNSHLRMTPDV